MQFATTLAAGILALAAAAQQSGEQEREVFYRYTDEHGVKVLNDQVPPRYVTEGYEVLTPSGRVLEVVPPQPSGGQLSAQRQLEARAEADRKLRMRYNSVADIENARGRKLAIAQQSINILKANISSLDNQIDSEEAAAARAQRNGDTVTPERLERIASLRKEKQVAQQRLERREEEVRQINVDFDQLVERYEALANNDIEPVH